VIAAFQESGALKCIVQDPIGEIPAMQLLDMRTTKWAVHGWDLARAINANDSLDTKLVEFSYACLAPRVDAWRGMSFFGHPKGIPTPRPSRRGCSTYSVGRYEVALRHRPLTDRTEEVSTHGGQSPGEHSVQACGGPPLWQHQMPPPCTTRRSWGKYWVAYPRYSVASAPKI
jgi:hypothetical protein